MASAASLFDPSQNNSGGLSQFNQVQFDSFVNEAPRQPDPFVSPMSLPAVQQTAPPPAPMQRSGPPSLEGNTAVFIFIFFNLVIGFEFILEDIEKIKDAIDRGGIFNQDELADYLE